MTQDADLKQLGWLYKAPREYAYPLSVMWLVYTNTMPHPGDLHVIHRLLNQTFEAAQAAGNADLPTPFGALADEIEKLPPESEYFHQAVGKCVKYFVDISRGKKDHPTTDDLMRLLHKRWARQHYNAALAEFQQ